MRHMLKKFIWQRAARVLNALLLCVFLACNPLGDSAISGLDHNLAEPLYGTWEIYRMERTWDSRIETLRSPGISGTITFFRNSEVMALQLSDSTGLPIEPFTSINPVNQHFSMYSYWRGTDFGKRISAGLYSFSVDWAGYDLILATSIDKDSVKVGLKFYSTRE